MRTFVAGLCLLASAAPALAAGENPAILAVDRSVSISDHVLGLYYVEPSGVDAFTVGSNYDDDEHGSIPGLKLAASWMFPDASDLYLHAEWAGSKGDVTYDGYTLSTPPLQINGAASHAVIQDWDFKAGKGVVTGAQWMLTPYVSFGGRHWERTLGPDTPFVYVESYNHFYAALGNLTQWAPSDKFVATLDTAVGRTFGANINSPDAGLDHQMLGASPVIKLGVEGDWAFSPRVHGFMGFDYMYFAYGQSAVSPANGGVLEPDSRTQEYNFDLGVRFAP